MTRQDAGTTETPNEIQAAASTRWLERGLALALLLWGFLFSLGCNLSTLNDDNVFIIDEGWAQDESGIYVSRLENPPLTGLTEVQDLNLREMALEGDPVQASRGHYEPEAIVVDSDVPVFAGAVTTAVGIHSDFLLASLEGEEGRVLQKFEVPSLSLPSNGEPATLELSRRLGPGPDRPRPAEETIRMRLSSDVIVLPVHVHHFAGPDGELASDRVNENVVRDLFDPSPNRVFIEALRFTPDSDRNIEHTADVYFGRVHPSRYLRPDPVWVQAGIQFHLESYDEIPQSDHLETSGYRETVQEYGLQNFDEADASGGVCNDNTYSRLGDFYERNHSHIPGIHIYLGGRLDTGGGGEYRAAACRVHRNITSDGSTGYDLDGIKLVAIDVRRGNWREVVPHELGHVLSLPHASTTGEAVALGPYTSLRTNLMNADASGTELTPAQKAQAREVACLWADRFGLEPPACEPIPVPDGFDPGAFDGPVPGSGFDPMLP